MRPGATVGDYRILEQLGRGGEGRVFKVEHVITRRKEAMKVLSAATLVDQDMARRFLREIRVQASLDHPHIAAVHNAFRHSDELVMVMELVDGAPLSELLDKRRLGWRRGVEIVAQVLGALDYAHAAGVVHRDVAPANIIVGPDGNIKLTDFGLAWTAGDMRMTRTGTFMGSVPYMSPEQVRGADKADARSDIYSAGVVLYEAVTGSRPFYAENAFQLMRAHVEQAPDPPRQRNPQIPGELERTILRALAKAPGERFATSGEFLRAVEAALLCAGPALPAAPAGREAAPETARGGPRPGIRVSWAAGLAAGLVLVGATSFSSLYLGGGPRAPEATPVTAKLFRPEAAAGAAPEPAPAPALPSPPNLVLEAGTAAPLAPSLASAPYVEPVAPVLEEEPRRNGLLRVLSKVRSLNPFRRGTSDEDSERENRAGQH